MLKKILLVTALCTAMLSTAAYAEEAAAPAADAAAQTEAAPADAAALKTMGTQEEGAFAVTLKNSTGKDIKSVMIRVTGEAAFTKEYLPIGEVFAKDEQRILYYKPAEKTAEPVQETTEASANMDEPKELPDGYEIQLIFVDEAAPADGQAAAPNTAVLHSFPFEAITEGELLMEEGVAYLKYLNTVTNTEITTLEYEKIIKLTQGQDTAAPAAGAAPAAAAAPTAAPAAPAAAAESAAPAAAVAAPVYTDNSADYTYDSSYDASYDYSYDDYSYDDYSYDSSYDSSYDASYDSSYDASYDSYSGGETSGGDDDACIEDGLMY